ncbi:MAG: hypothetical protein WCY55_05570 [Anaerovoracaceae bacterium]|jgi:hypothetical protein
MRNHLRIALKHFLDRPEEIVIRGSFCVRRVTIQNTEAVLITHLTFMGRDEFNTCIWIPQSNTLFVCPGAEKLTSEIAFVIRSIRRLGMILDHIKLPNSTDVTKEYERYLIE